MCCYLFLDKNNHTVTVNRSTSKQAIDDDYECKDYAITVQDYHSKKRHDYNYNKQQLQCDGKLNYNNDK